MKFKRLQIRKMRLATKVSIVITLMLLVLFTLQSVFSSISVNKTITDAIRGEFAGVAAQNGITIQDIIQSSTQVGEDIQSYLNDVFTSEDIYTNEEIKKSRYFDIEISEMNYQAERFMLNTAARAVEKNSDIMGIGILFEPYMFDNDIKDYMFYIDKNSLKESTVHTSKTIGTIEEYNAKEYYVQAANTKKPYVSNPYKNKDGATLITAAYPIVKNDGVIGIVAVDVSLESFNSIKTTDEDYETMFVSILTNNGTIVYDSRSEGNVNKNISTYFQDAKDYETLLNGFSTEKPFASIAESETGKVIEQFCFPIEVADTIWWGRTSLELNDLNKEVNRLMVVTGGIAVTFLVVIAASIIILLQKMLAPIHALANASTEIAAGHLDMHIDEKSEDEIGVLTNTFNKMCGNLKEIIDDVNHCLGAMAEGDFEIATTCQDKYIGDFENILLAMRGIKLNLRDTLTQINLVSEQVAVGSEQMANSAVVLSEGATEQASSVEEVAATISKISDRIQNNADSTNKGKQDSDEARMLAQQSNEYMQDMIAAMDEISKTSDEIDKIIKSINEIAFQTNILALNAAIEAARAGSAGKGFSVVAEEVRNLAEKSAVSAKNTEALIARSIYAVKNGVEIAQKTAEALDGAVVKAKAANYVINEIAIASEDQANSIVQVTQAFEQISAVVQTNSATAEESAAASEELTGQAQMLNQLIDRFKLGQDDGSTEEVEKHNITDLESYEDDDHSKY